jgi:hypothetical protein
MPTRVVYACDGCHLEAPGVSGRVPPSGWRIIAISSVYSGIRKEAVICPDCFPTIKLSELTD